MGLGVNIKDSLTIAEPMKTYNVHPFTFTPDNLKEIKNVELTLIEMRLYLKFYIKKCNK